MGIKLKSIAESIINNGIKMLVYGEAGQGKTVLGATADAPTLIISAESGLLSLNQNAEALRKKGSPTFRPEKCKVVEISTLEELKEVYDHLENNKTEFEWIVLDSITEIAEVVLSDAFEKSKDPRVVYPELVSKMTKILKSFRDLECYHMIMISKQQRITDDLTGITSYIPAMPGNQLPQQIPHLFDIVGCLRTAKDEEGNVFTYLQAVKDNQYACKDRSGLLTAMEPPSLAMIYKKIYGENENVNNELKKRREIENLSVDDQTNVGKIPMSKADEIAIKNMGIRACE